MKTEKFAGTAGSGDALRVQGAVVAAKLGHDEATFNALVASGEDVPSIPVHLLIDTGASASFIESHVVQTLKLRPLFLENVYLADHSEVSCRGYRAVLSLPLEGGSSSRMASIPMRFLSVPNARFDKPFQGLLGRDFLSRFGFFYDGPRGLFELHCPPGL